MSRLCLLRHCKTDKIGYKYQKEFLINQRQGSQARIMNDFRNWRKFFCCLPLLFTTGPTQGLFLTRAYSSRITFQGGRHSSFCRAASRGRKRLSSLHIQQTCVRSFSATDGAGFGFLSALWLSLRVQSHVPFTRLTTNTADTSVLCVHGPATVRASETSAR